MKKLVLVAIASIFAATGAVSTASASLSDRDGTVWHQKNAVQVARGGDKGGRNDGGRNDGGRGRDAHRDKKGDKVIWRIRDGKHRPFWLFRHDRGEDCFVRKMPVENADGSVSTRSIRLCE
jgi:hypothetical protein